MVRHPLVVIKEISPEACWPIRHQVMWPNLPFEFIKLTEDPQGNHFGFFKNDVLISVISLFETASGKAQFRKFATIDTEQGKGYGSKLFNYVIAFAKKQGYHTLWCNARVDKAEFYKKFGMIETEETFVKEGVRFMILKKAL